MAPDPRVVRVVGGFDDLRSADVRFLEEASRIGEVEVLLLSDEALQLRTGRPPVFPQAERRFLVSSLRFVSRVRPVDAGEADRVWDDVSAGVSRRAMRESEVTEGLRARAARLGIDLVAIPDDRLAAFPDAGAPFPPGEPTDGSRLKVIVTGCYDWLHSGHVRFFEEAAGLGDLFVTVGSDANVAHLKGEGHPLFPAAERRYMVGAVRFVRQALVASGWGYLDAVPEIERIRPDLWVVNEDGDRPEKRVFCDAHGIEFRVLRRLPRPGLPARQSTDFRGF